MAYLRVAYKKKDIDFDYISGSRLDTLIARDEISHFFRPAEKKWVSVKFDAIRRAGGEEYQGPERRVNGRPAWMDHPGSENSSSKKATPPRDWLESLWREIENR
jgi:hypothetical protein